MPNGLGAAGSVTVKVTGPGGVTAQRTMAATAISPGLFTLGITDYPQCQGKGLLCATSATVFNQDGSLNSCSNPAAPGSQVSVLLNGTGMLAPSVVDNGNHPLPGVQVEGAEPEAGQPVGVWRVLLRSQRSPLCLLIPHGERRPGAGAERRHLGRAVSHSFYKG
jgi:hypothetical protein